MDPPHSSSAPGMEGFGSADVSTPFHYGSVHDGQYRSDSFEQKLKKQYWKTKQTVIQKLGKNQDEFIVAGDADIDTKLECAYHLQSSCSELLRALDKYMARLRTLSIQESVMGEHLRTWSETEYTNAGEVMQNVGKLQARNSQVRNNVIPPLLRMHSEFAVFRDSAIKDLNFSIQSLEKARTEYRAALLWMKDVSEKLHNPDYKDQLIRFREAQAAVKETKRRFDKLKVDLGEKIGMVSASRCNLLSRSLPNYQKEMLNYSDTIANDFHGLLVDLRTHHHHQYKVRRVLEEIRDLESEELPFNDRAVQDEFSALNIPEVGERPLFDDSDDPLLDLGKDPPPSDRTTEGEGGAKDETGASELEEAKKKQMDGVQEPFRRVGDPFSFEKVAEQAKVKDLVLGGIEAELKALQNEMVNPRDPTAGSQPHPRPSSGGSGGGGVGGGGPVSEGGTNEGAKSQGGGQSDDIDDLLQLGDEDLDSPSLLDQPVSGEDPSSTTGQQQQDYLVSEWNNFSAFMPATREGGTKSPLAGWEKELAGSPTPPPPSSSSSSLVPQDSTTPLSPTTAAASPSVPLNSSLGSNGVPAASLESTTNSKPDPSTANAQLPASPLSPPGSAAKDPTAMDDDTLTEDASIDKLLGLGANSYTNDSEGMASELLSDELQSLGISNSPPKAQNHSESAAQSASGLGGINSALFQYHSVQSQYQVPAGATRAVTGSGTTSFRSPLGSSQGPPVFPTQGAMGMAMAPPKFGLVSPGPAAQAGSPAGGVPGGGVMRGRAKEEEKKGNTWMNFFAHLDPLANEKV